MKNFNKIIYFVLIIFFASQNTCNAQTVILTSFTQNSVEIPRLGKYEVTFNLDKVWSNPYDNSNEVEINAYFTLPNGTIEQIAGFWYEGFSRSLVGNDEQLSPNGNNGWKLRYAPKFLGNYSYYIEIIDRTNSNQVTRYPSTGSVSFTSISTTGKGFLKVSDTDKAYLDYEDNTPYVGLGHNLLGWEWEGNTNSRGTYDYDDWLAKMATNGANMAQFDFCETDQIEWTFDADELPFSNAWEGIGKYNPQNSWKMDYRFDKAADLDIFFRLTLSHWEEFDKEALVYPDYGWNRNPYNSANGGPVANVSLFFTDATAKAYYKQYLRYVVARWGYSKNILTYELWNEVDSNEIVWANNGNYNKNKNNITAWHSEMSTYLKQIDPNHLITTSFASSEREPNIWSLPNIDLTTVHRYTYFNTSYPGGFDHWETEGMTGYVVQSRNSFFKPIIFGEFALSPNGWDQMTNDTTGEYGFHNQLWSSIMQRALGTSMHWQWDKYIDDFDLYDHYKPLGIFLQNEDLRNLQIYKSNNGIVRTYGLKNWEKAFVWVQDLNHTFINRNLPQNVISGETLTMSVFDNGTYSVEFLNTYTGVIVSTTTLTSSAGKLEISIPDFTKDIAIKIKKITGASTSTNYAINPGFEDNAGTQTPNAWDTWPGFSGLNADADFTQNLTPKSGNYRATHYKASAYEIYTSQTITGLENGVYNLKFWVISSGGQNVSFIEAKDYGSTVKLSANIPATATWTQIEIPDILVANGQCTIGLYSNANAGNWLGYDDIEFTKEAGSSLGVNESKINIENNDTVVLYPMPVENLLHIGNFELLKDGVKIYNVQGMLLLDINEIDLKEGKIDMSQFKSGIYILNSNLKKGGLFQKLFIKK